MYEGIFHKIAKEKGYSPDTSANFTIYNTNGDTHSHWLCYLDGKVAMWGDRIAQEAGATLLRRAISALWGDRPVGEAYNTGFINLRSSQMADLIDVMMENYPV